jgi:hypothetical protein
MNEFFIKPNTSYNHTSITGSDYPKGKEKLQTATLKALTTKQTAGFIGLQQKQNTLPSNLTQNQQNGQPNKTADNSTIQAENLFCRFHNWTR